MNLDQDQPTTTPCSFGGGPLLSHAPNTDMRPTLPSTDQLDTIPSFASAHHAPEIWRQVCDHLEDGDLLALAELLAVGITSNRQLSESTGWCLETVTTNRALLDERAIELGSKLSFD